MKKIFLTFVVFSVLLVTFFEDILRYYGSFLEINNAQKGADMILILSGHADTRTPKAVELFENNFSEEIFITDAIKYPPDYDFILSESEKIKKILEFHKIPKAKIHLLESTKNGATSTFDEAYDLVNFLTQKNNLLKYKKIILVTDNYHTRRALYAFKKVFEINGLSQKIDIQVASAQSGDFNKNNWWLHEFGLLSYIPEFFKLVIYYLTDQNIQVIENR